MVQSLLVSSCLGKGPKGVKQVSGLCWLLVACEVLLAPKLHMLLLSSRVEGHQTLG